VKSECITLEYQAPGPHEAVWYGSSVSGVDISNSPRLIVLRRGDVWPKNLVLAYGLAPRLSDLTVTPALFNPASAPLPLSGEEFRFNVWSANSASVVSVRAEFRNRSSGSILRTITTSALPVGSRLIVWDGRADNGAFVAPGIYDVTLTASDPLGGAAVLKPVVIVAY
jgi:FlgD Ig-like domain